MKSTNLIKNLEINHIFINRNRIFKTYRIKINSFIIRKLKAINKIN